jgi:fructosamine-3-kinase
MPQVELALMNKLLETAHALQFEKLYKKLEQIFPSGPSSLLHGDLWSGNFLADDMGNPVLIDPAVYFGHRSMDLAMTTLFGGFQKAFYESYHYYYPFPENYQQQWDICNLYPLLIHLNLFGKSYQSDIVRTIAQY